MKSDTELLAALGKFLRSRAPKGHQAIVMKSPVAGFDDAEQIARTLALAESKWFVDQIARTNGQDGPKWTFDLTTRGAEVFDLD